MRTIIAVMGILGTVALGLAGYLISDGHKALAFKFLIVSIVIYGLDLVLVIADHLSKSVDAPISIFKKPTRKRLASNERLPLNNAAPIRLINQQPDLARPLESAAKKNSEAHINPLEQRYSENPKLRQALIRLQTLSDHITNEDIAEKYVNDYHSLLDLIQTEIGEDLSPFRIPESVLVRQLSGIRWEGAYHGYQYDYSEELFCPPNDFLIAIRGALNFIATCPPKPKAKEEPAKPEPLVITETTVESPKSAPLMSKFNVLWDENRDPFCPLCKRLLIPPMLTGIGSKKLGDLKCMACQQFFSLMNDKGEP